MKDRSDWKIIENYTRKATGSDFIPPGPFSKRQEKGILNVQKIQFPTETNGGRRCRLFNRWNTNRALYHLQNLW